MYTWPQADEDATSEHVTLIIESHLESPLSIVTQNLQYSQTLRLRQLHTCL